MFALNQYESVDFVSVVDVLFWRETLQFDVSAVNESLRFICLLSFQKDLDYVKYCAVCFVNK